MPHYLWTKLLWHISDFGDVAVALPIAAILVAWLCLRGRRQTGLWYAVAVLGCSVTIFLLKMAFFAGDLRLPALGLHNPSGHSAVGAVVYGSLAWILSREMPGWRGRVLLLLGCAGVVAIGVSLYVLRAHTLPDVVVGLTLGSACAAAFSWRGYRDDIAARGAPPVRLMLAIVVVAISVQGLQLAAQLPATSLLFKIPSSAAPA